MLSSTFSWRHGPKATACSEPPGFVWRSLLWSKCASHCRLLHLLIFSRRHREGFSCQTGLFLPFGILEVAALLFGSRRWTVLSLSTDLWTWVQLVRVFQYFSYIFFYFFRKTNRPQIPSSFVTGFFLTLRFLSEAHWFSLGVHLSPYSFCVIVLALMHHLKKNLSLFFSSLLQIKICTAWRIAATVLLSSLYCYFEL